VPGSASHPGVVRTSFGARTRRAHFAVLIRAARPFMKTAAQGAVTPVYLAKTVYDTTAAARLWQVSADLADLTATA
jgi:retinol dehydrogenase-14